MTKDYTVSAETHRMRIQALGAAISRRDWSEVEHAHANLRDAFDRFPDIGGGAVAQAPQSVAGTGQQSPPEVAAGLEAAADHAGASAATYRRLAALMKEPGFGHPLMSVTVKDGVISGVSAIPPQLDIEKALRDAYGRGYAHCGRQTGEAPQGLNGYNEERDAWIRQYVARLAGGSDA